MNQANEAGDPQGQRAGEADPPGRLGFEEMGRWIFGVLMGLLAFLGLVLASRATDAVFEWFGLLLFLFGVLFIFGMIHLYVGRDEPR